jgi:hypothetical protein
MAKAALEARVGLLLENETKNSTFATTFSLYAVGTLFSKPGHAQGRNQANTHIEKGSSKTLCQHRSTEKKRCAYHLLGVLVIGPGDRRRGGIEDPPLDQFSDFSFVVLSNQSVCS